MRPLATGAHASGNATHRASRRSGRLLDFVLLEPLSNFADLALFCLRVLTGAFLIHGVWDNITSEARMVEFVEFLTLHRFAYPDLLAPLSVWAQFLCGAAFLLGAATRWAGLICTFNFAVAVWMVHWPQDFRGWWPAIVLVAIGLYLSTRGPGRYSVDALLDRHFRRA